jgi:hypothetical protein
VGVCSRRNVLCIYATGTRLSHRSGSLRGLQPANGAWQVFRAGVCREGNRGKQHVTWPALFQIHINTPRPEYLHPSGQQAAANGTRMPCSGGRLLRSPSVRRRDIPGLGRAEGIVCSIRRLCHPVTRCLLLLGRACVTSQPTPNTARLCECTTRQEVTLFYFIRSELPWSVPLSTHCPFRKSPSDSRPRPLAPPPNRAAFP